MARSLLARLLGLLYPLLMGTVVVVSGNHYIADGLGALAVLTVSFLIVSLLSRGARKGDDGAATVAPAPQAGVPARPRSHAA